MDAVLTFRKTTSFIFTSFLLLCFSYDVRWFVKKDGGHWPNDSGQPKSERP